MTTLWGVSTKGQAARYTAAYLMGSAQTADGPNVVAGGSRLRMQPGPCYAGAGQGLGHSAGNGAVLSAVMFREDRPTTGKESRFWLDHRSRAAA